MNVTGHLIPLDCCQLVHSQLSSNICWCSCVVSWSCSSMLSLQVLPWASWVPCAFRWWSENWYNSSVNVLWSYRQHFKSTIFHKTFPPAIESELPLLSKMSLYAIRASTRVLIPCKKCVQSSCLLLKQMTEASKPVITAWQSNLRSHTKNAHSIFVWSATQLHMSGVTA